jgi:predicted MFS family arabinose efflux permease
MAGALVQAIAPLWTLLFDAATFLVSAGSLALIRTREPAPGPPGTRPGLWPEVRQGLAFVARDPRLRALTGCSATRSLFGGFFEALYVVFASRDLGLPAALVGLLVGLGGVGALLGAAATGRITDRVGPGRTLVGAALLAGGLNLLVPVAALPGAPAPALLGAAQLLGDGAAIAYIVVAVSYRQTVTPDTLLGRTNATVRSLMVGAQLVGAVVGGLLAVAFGTALALLIAAVGMLLAPAWLVLSPVPALETAAPD